MDDLKWFKIDIIYPLNSGFESNEELSEIDAIRLKAEGILDDYETGVGIYNLSVSTIANLTPKCFVPKGKTNKKYYTEIVFDTGDFAFALGKPEFVYDKINEYYNSLPRPEDMPDIEIIGDK